MIVVGLSHRTAPIDVRERLAIAPKALPATLVELAKAAPVGEVVILSTCNRVEIYAEGAHDDEVREAITRELTRIGGRQVAPHLVSHSGTEALLHVFRVACSLDSLVVGEPQILGQLKSAIKIADKAGTLGRKLTTVMRAAVQAAKRVRTETQIGAGQVSVPSVAVDLAHQIYEDLRGQNTLMVGAGEMAESAAKLLARAGARIVVANRSPERASALATRVGGAAVPWERLESSLVDADIVIASTASPKHVITYDLLKSLRRKRRGRSLFLIDIAVPRDVEPKVNKLDNVYLYDIDDLSHVVAQSLEVRRAEAEHAESIVAEETASFGKRSAQQSVKPVIVALRERTRQTLLNELERSFRGRLKHLTDDDRASLTTMIDAAVNKLLHAPTRHLKTLAANNDAGHASELMEALFELGENERDQQATSKPAVEEDDDVDPGDEDAPQPRAAAR